MSVKNISLVWITVSDLAAAKKFFVDGLGMKLTQDSPEHGWLELAGQEEGGTALGIAQINKDQPAEKNAITTFTVADVVASKAELENKGVTFIGDIIEVPGHVKMIMFTDADGNRFQLVQLLS